MVNIRRNYNLDALLVTRRRTIVRHNSMPDIFIPGPSDGQPSPRSILKKNDLPFAIRGRRKSVSFGTISRKDISLETPEYNAQQQNAIQFTSELTPSTNSDGLGASEPVPTTSINDSMSPTLNIVPIGTPKTYGKDLPITPKRKLLKGTTTAILLNRINESHDNNLLPGVMDLNDMSDPIEDIDENVGQISFD